MEMNTWKKTFALIVLGLLPGLLAGQQSVPVEMYFAGDIMQHDPQLAAARVDSSQYDYTECFQYVAPEIQAATIALANLELPLGVLPYSGYPRFCAPVAFAVAVKRAGFDILVTANNHSLDRYKKGVVRTVEILDSLKIPHTGIFRDTTERERRYPMLFQKNGIRFALLNYTYGTNGIPHRPPTYVNVIDTAQIKKDIEAAKSRHPDIIIASMHWGLEYKMLPEKSQVELADFLTGHGVNVVIGGHPHVVQPMHAPTDSTGRIENVVVYSLGNYISNQKNIDTQGGATVRITFVKEDTGVRIADCSYGLVWVWKPVVAGRQKFYLLPVREAEKKTFPLSEEDYVRMNTFAKNARRLFDKYNTHVKEYQPE